MKAFIYPAVIIFFICGAAGTTLQVACVLAVAGGATSWVSWELAE